MKAEIVQTVGGEATPFLVVDVSSYGIEAGLRCMMLNRMFSPETRGAFELAAEILSKVSADPAAHAAIQQAIDVFNQRRKIP